MLDAGSILEKYGYHCPHGNSVGSEISRDINNPDWWFLPYGARYFREEENQHILKAIGVFFLDINHNPIKPIIIFGCFKMKEKDDGEKTDFAYWYLKEAWFSKVEDHQMNVNLSIEGSWNFEKGLIRAIPLEEVFDQVTLQNKIIEPLKAMSY